MVCSCNLVRTKFRVLSNARNGLDSSFVATPLRLMSHRGARSAFHASLLVLTYSLTHLLTRPWLGSTSPLTMLWWSRSSTSRSRSPLRVSGAGRLLHCLFVCLVCAACVHFTGKSNSQWWSWGHSTWICRLCVSACVIVW